MTDELQDMIFPRDPEGSLRTGDEHRWNRLIEYIATLESRVEVLEKRADDEDTRNMEARERE